MAVGRLHAAEWGGGKCAGLGLNDLTDKKHVYFLNRAPPATKSRHCGLQRNGPSFHSSRLFSRSARGQQMVTLDAQTEKN